MPVRGFFEWQHTQAGKVPWYISRADEDIMSLAGLWSEWTDRSTGETLNTFSVITTDANNLMATIHNSKKRMPVIIERESEEKWLDQVTETGELKKILIPYPDSILDAHTISNLVNSRTADKNTPELIRPSVRSTDNLLF